MKKITRTAATSVLAVAALGLAAGTANAAPALTPPAPNNSTISIDVLPGVHYTADAADHSVVLNTGLGSLTTVGGQFQLLDGRGQLMAGTPLAPPPSIAAGAPATLASATLPTTKADAAVTPALPLHDVDATSDFNGALSVAATQFGLATGIGGLAGGAIGGIGGCIIGGTVGAAVLPVLFLATGPAGCLVGLGIGATVGSITGSLLLGVPVGIASAVQMYNTLHANGEA